MKEIAGLLHCHTNLLLQNGFTTGVIALQGPRSIIHALSVCTPCKKEKRKRLTDGWHIGRKVTDKTAIGKNNVKIVYTSGYYKLNHITVTQNKTFTT